MSLLASFALLNNRYTTKAVPTFLLRSMPSSSQTLAGKKHLS